MRAASIEGENRAGYRHETSQSACPFISAKTRARENLRPEQPGCMVEKTAAHAHARRRRISARCCLSAWPACSCSARSYGETFHYQGGEGLARRWATSVRPEAPTEACPSHSGSPAPMPWRRTRDHRCRVLADFVIQAATTRSTELGQPFTRWSLRKLFAYLRKVHGPVSPKTRLHASVTAARICYGWP